LTGAAAGVETRWVATTSNGSDRRDGLSGDVVNVVPPILHITENGNYIIKGSRVTDPEALGQKTIPDHETCVEVSRSAIVALVGG
jgi:hypothetical protein